MKTEQAWIDEIIGRLVKIYNPIVIYHMNKEYWFDNEQPEDTNLRIIISKSTINDPSNIPDNAPVLRAEVGEEALKDIPGKKFLLVFTKAEFDYLADGLELTFLHITNYGDKIYERPGEDTPHWDAPANPYQAPT